MTQADNHDGHLNRGILVYIFGPMTGGILAGYIYKVHFAIFKRFQKRKDEYVRLRSLSFPKSFSDSKETQLSEKFLNYDGPA